MNKEKTLRELGEEYEMAAEKIKIIIAEKRLKLKKAPECSNEAYELKRELRILYSQVRDTKEIAYYLKSYYDPHNGCREIFRYK